MRPWVVVCLCLGSVATAAPAAAPGPAGSANVFACELYARLAAGPGNVIFSPAGVVTVLSMTLAGARGRTEQEIAAVLHTEPDDLAAAGEFQRQLVAGGEDLLVANRLWVQRGLALAAPFLAICRDDFAAPVGEVDFAGDGARQQINLWVSDQTQGKIPELLAASDLSRGVGLVLTDAVHFTGQWMDPFEPGATRERPFYLADGTAIQTATMGNSGSYSYAETAEVQALRLPYAGGRQVCEIYLPRQRDGLPELETLLAAHWLNAWIDRWRPHTVAIALPRFTVAARFELASALAAMGMPTAFTGDADFSGITPADRLILADVVHAAQVAVDEAGTEAAAATAAPMTRGIPGVLTTAFVADHPFLFLIRDTETGAVLFLGRLADPRW